MCGAWSAAARVGSASCTPPEADALAARLQSRYGIPLLVMSLGPQGALAYDTSRHECRALEAEVINRFGIGDAFNAGFLSVYLTEGNLDHALEWGCAAAAIKATIPNVHYPLVTAEQIRTVLDPKRGSGRSTILR